MNALLDCGATHSVLHIDKYDSMINKPSLNATTTNLVMGDGTTVETSGTVTLDVQIDTFTVQQTFIVADIQLPAVLGFDFLKANNGIINVANETLQLSGNTFFRIFLEYQFQKLTIPPNSEM